MLAKTRQERMTYMQRQMPCCGAKLSFIADASDNHQAIGEFILIKVGSGTLTFFCPAGAIASRLTIEVQGINFCPFCGRKLNPEYVAPQSAAEDHAPTQRKHDTEGQDRDVPRPDRTGRFLFVCYFVPCSMLKVCAISPLSFRTITRNPLYDTRPQDNV